LGSRSSPTTKPVSKEKLVDLSDSGEIELIVTTGGTGFGARDNTPEATLAVIEREAPGLAEWMRHQGARNTPMAILSRGVLWHSRKNADPEFSRFADGCK
jgi:molybdopterin biosynthesis enzyme MoaB